MIFANCEVYFFWKMRVTHQNRITLHLPGYIFNLNSKTMRINLPGVSSLALLVMLSSCELLEDLEAPISPEPCEEVSSTDHNGRHIPGCILVTEHMPSFPGGGTALLKFIAGNLELAPKSRDCYFGTITVIQFIIDENGKINSPKIVRSIHPDIDEACLKLIAKMPKWLPAEQRGQPVRTQMNLPIRVRLE